MKKNNYLSIGKNVIDLEITALKKLKRSLDNSFNQAVEVISKCESKVILCGVGKSGLIASKISATFSSVGTPSLYYLRVTLLTVIWEEFQEKICVLISYSGNTEELKNLSNLLIEIELN